MDLTQKDALLELLWNSLKPVEGQPDQRQTGWGTKTKIGLLACIERLESEAQERSSRALCAMVGPHPLTLKMAKERLSALGVTIRRIEGEYRVSVKGSREPYFTDALIDAYLTGKAMAEYMREISTCPVDRFVCQNTGKMVG